MGFKRSYKNPWEDNEFKSFFRKAKTGGKKAGKWGIPKMAISQRLVYALKLYDMGTWKIKSKKI